MVNAGQVCACHRRRQQGQAKQDDIRGGFLRSSNLHFRFISRGRRNISGDFGYNRGAIFSHVCACTLTSTPGPAAKASAALPSRTAISSISKLPNSASGACLGTSPYVLETTTGALCLILTKSVRVGKRARKASTRERGKFVTRFP